MNPERLGRGGSFVAAMLVHKRISRLTRRLEKVVREKEKAAESALLATRVLNEAMLNVEDFEMGASGRLASACCRQRASQRTRISLRNS
jgi:hypothetical protein